MTRDDYYGNREFDQYPVIRVTWKQAQHFCAWRGANLPTEAQWEKAARGDLGGMKYPWGNDSPVCQVSAENGAQFSICNPFDTNEVGSFFPNGYGLFDMVGNVWEWVYDWYSQDYYKVTKSKNPQGPEQGIYHVARGGAFDGGSGVIRVANRSRDVPGDTPLTIGFRCAR